MLYIEVGKNQVEYKVKDTYVVWVRGHLIGSVPEDTKLFDLFKYITRYSDLALGPISSATVFEVSRPDF